MNERILQLKKQVDDLLEWKKNDQQQQITLQNFGPNSRNIFHIDHMLFTGKTVAEPFASAEISLEAVFGDLNVFLPVLFST